MKTEKSNELIAKFMGYSKHPDYDGFEIGGDPYHASQLRYHNDWNWLIPVVEKIESIKDKHHGYFGVYINSNSCTIQGTNLRLDEPMSNPPIYYGQRVSDTKLNATYEAVFDFIKWYNKQIKIE